MSTPKLCCAHTVSGTATIRMFARDITVPEGEYWTDPVYSSASIAPASDATDLWVQLLYRYNLAATETGLAEYGAAPTANFHVIAWAGTAAGIVFHGEHANTTTAGKKILRRLGVSQIAQDGSASVADQISGDLVSGIWCQNRNEVGDVDERFTGFGHTFRSYNGTSYAFNLGDQLASRMVSFGAVTGALARRRDNAYGTLDYSFERLIARVLMNGEKVRYYADSSVAQAYLTTAMTARSTTAVLSIATGFAANIALCIDGEWVQVSAWNAGTKTATLVRDNPVAHAKFAPVSKKFVGTYVLDNAGGDVCMDDFFPRRRAVNQDRWDISMSLVRAS